MVRSGQILTHACKYEKDQMKNSGENVMMSMGFFSDAQGQPTR